MTTKTISILALIAAASSALAQSDPLTPSRVVETAWKKRQIVQAARVQIQEARARKRAATAFPATMLNIGRGTDRVPGATDNDLSLIQPLDLFGRNRAAGRTADTEISLAEIDLRATQLSVQTEALTAYNELVAAEKRLAVTQALLDVAVKLHDAALRKVELGEAPEVQAYRARIELGRARQAFELRQTEVASARQRLSGASGESLAGDPEGFFSTPDLMTVDLAVVRPDLMVFAGELNRVDALIAEQRLSSRPEAALEARRSAWSDQVQFGFRIQLSLPLADYGRNRSEIRALELQRESVEKRLADARALAESELTATQTDVDAARNQVKRFRELLGDARELVEIAQKGFDSGALTLVETLEASRALREVEESLVEAELSLAQRHVSLSRAAGHLLEVQL